MERDHGLAPAQTESNLYDGQATVDKIEMFADVWCPFAHVSLHSVRSLRDEIAPHIPIVVRAWPLELINGAPLEPSRIAEHVVMLKRDVAPQLFAGFRPDAVPRSTLPALALVEAASDVDPWLGERLSVDLRETLFEQGRPIDAELLATLATEIDIDPALLHEVDPVVARLEEGRRRGVLGSPHLFVGSADWFCPLLDEERHRAVALDMSLRMERLRAFLVAALQNEDSETRPS
jgi:hypothetical protein